MIPLLIAAALSISNVTDYVCVTPASSTNMLLGVGIGSDGLYRTVRAEDLDFLAEAFAERMTAAEVFLGLPAFMDAPGRIPRQFFITTDFEMTNCYPVTYGVTNRLATGSPHGFVPASFAPWTGFYRCESPDGWIRNGYDAQHDIRAVFGDASIPYAVTNVPGPVALTNALAFAVMTNAYDVIEHGPFDAILNEPDLFRRDGYSELTNSVITEDSYTQVEYHNVNYQVQGRTRWYTDSVTVTGTHTQGSTNRVAKGDFIGCRCEHEVMSVNRLTVKCDSIVGNAGTLFVTEPWALSETFVTERPVTSSAWRFVPRVQAYYDGGMVYSTNLTVRAYLVILWDCLSERSCTGSYGVSGMPFDRGWSTNQVVKAITVTDLGTLQKSDPLMTIGRAEVYVAGSTVDSIVTTTRGFAEVSRCWRGRFFEHPVLENEQTLDPSDYPAHVDSGWAYSTTMYDSSGFVNNFARNSLIARRIYCLAVIQPVYHARVL